MDYFCNHFAINLNIFKSIVNRAIEIDKFLKPEQNPFLGYKYDREVSTTKEKLNEAEIMKQKYIMGIVHEIKIEWNY